MRTDFDVAGARCGRRAAAAHAVPPSAKAEEERAMLAQRRWSFEEYAMVQHGSFEVVDVGLPKGCC